MGKGKSRRDKESRWNTRNILAIGGITAILVLGLVFIFPTVVSFTDSGNATIGEANCSINLEVIGYKDGVPVTASLVNNPFTIGGAPVDSLVLTVSWVATGSGVDWNTFVLDGEIIVKQDIEDSWVTKYSSTWSSSEKSGNHSETLVLGVDICKAEDLQAEGYGDYVDYYWRLEISAPVSVSAVDEAGVPLWDTVSPKMAGTLDILWDSSLEVAGSWNWDY